MATKNIKVVDEPGDGPYMEAYIDGEVGVGGEAATVDTLQGATETGRAIMKAESAEAARSAIGAGTSSFSGSYNDLSNKPTVPAAADAVADVSAADAAAAAADTVTRAEFDAVVTLANEAKSKLNSLLAAMRTSGLLKS